MILCEHFGRQLARVSKLCVGDVKKEIQKCYAITPRRWKLLGNQMQFHTKAFRMIWVWLAHNCSPNYGLEIPRTSLRSNGQLRCLFLLNDYWRLFKLWNRKSLDRKWFFNMLHNSPSLDPVSGSRAKSDIVLWFPISLDLWLPFLIILTKTNFSEINSNDKVILIEN